MSAKQNRFEIADLAAVHLWQADPAKPIFLGEVTEYSLRKMPPGHQEMHCVPGTYRLAELMVLRPDRLRPVDKKRRRYDVLLRTSPPGYGHTYSAGGEIWEPPLFWRYPQVAGSLYRMQRSPHDVTPEDYWTKRADHFEVAPGQENEWTIPLPEELVTAVRSALKADAAARRDTASPASTANRK